MKRRQKYGEIEKEDVMKLIALFLTCILIFTCTCAFAEDINISLKQGLIFTWKGQQLKNLTCTKVANTKVIESWGKWNALWAGWSLDAGWAYDGSEVNSCALMLGRKLGTLGDYLPIDFPFADKLEITLYPVGMYAVSIFDHPKIQGASGGSFLKIEVKF